MESLVNVINIDTKFIVNNSNTGSFTYKLKYPLIINYIRLSSIELSNIWYTFTKAKNNISFIITVDKIDYPVVIEDGSYTSDLMLNYIQDVFNGLNKNHGFKFQITFNEITSRVTLSNNSDKIFSINFKNNTKYDSLGYSLGFRSDNYSGKLSYYAESILDTIGDQYIYVKVNDYGVLHNNVLTENIIIYLVKYIHY